MHGTLSHPVMDCGDGWARQRVLALSARVWRWLCPCVCAPDMASIRWRAENLLEPICWLLHCPKGLTDTRSRLSLLSCVRRSDRPLIVQLFVVGLGLGVVALVYLPKKVPHRWELKFMVAQVRPT